MESTEKQRAVQEIIAERNMRRDYRVADAEKFLEAGKHLEAMEQYASASRQVEGLVRLVPDEALRDGFRGEAAHLRLKAAKIALDKWGELKAGAGKAPELSGEVEGIGERVDERVVELLSASLSGGGRSRFGGRRTFQEDGLFVEHPKSFVGHHPADEALSWWYRGVTQLVEARAHMRKLKVLGKNKGVFGEYHRQLSRVDDDKVAGMLSLGVRFPHSSDAGKRDAVGFNLELMDLMPDAVPESGGQKRRRAVKQK